MPTPAVVFFEIPVREMDRAMCFYRDVFECEFETMVVDGNDMAFFSTSTEGPGISGALAKGDAYHPSSQGVIIYFATDSIDTTLQKVLMHGGHLHYPKTHNEFGFVAEFIDIEGNRIALFEQRQSEQT
jgi:predicted enzyme related to lactoylglutathione lyase